MAALSEAMATVSQSDVDAAIARMQDLDDQIRVLMVAQCGEGKSRKDFLMEKASSEGQTFRQLWCAAYVLRRPFTCMLVAGTSILNHQGLMHCAT